MKCLNTTYKISDFFQWKQDSQLITNPSFQRNKVWSFTAKSYLIDSIIKGFPVPYIFLREKIDHESYKTKREIIDGQQRITTILDYMNNKFKVSKSHNTGIANKYYKDLSNDEKETILSYELSCKIFSNNDDTMIHEIFARLNTVNYPLKPQELRNAKYFGEFRTTIENITKSIYNEVFNLNIYSKNDLNRMKLEEDLARIIIFCMHGFVKDDKKIIDSFYKKYDDYQNFPNSREIEKEVISVCFETINVLKDIKLLNKNVLPNKKDGFIYFKNIYFFTIFMLIKTERKLSELQLKNLSNLERLLFFKNTAIKGFENEKNDLLSDRELSEICEKITLSQESSADASKKEQRIFWITKYINR